MSYTNVARPMQSAHTISRASLASKSMTPAGSIRSSVAVQKSVQKSQRTVASVAKLSSAPSTKRDMKSEMPNDELCKLNNSSSKPTEAKHIEWLEPKKLQKEIEVQRMRQDQKDKVLRVGGENTTRKLKESDRLQARVRQGMAAYPCTYTGH